MSVHEKNINKRHCCVSECKTNNGETNSLHRFPLRDKNLYTKWLRILKIRKPTKEMYVCSRHFTENDFFGGWLAVEPNKKRLKRGVVPSLELPKASDDTQKVEDNKKNLLDQPEDFAASLNLKPVEKNIANSSQGSVLNGCNRTKENEENAKQNSGKRKVESLELSSTDSDNLLILKRIGEIKEAPEYQAKKKHDAQIHMKKMRELKKMQVKKLTLGNHINELSSESSKLKVKTIQELTQPHFKKMTLIPPLENAEVETIEKKPHEQVKVNSHSPVKEVRLLSSKVESIRKKPLAQVQAIPQSQLKKVLSQAEVETFQKNPHGQVEVSSQSQVKKGRVLSQAEVEAFQQKLPMQVKMNSETQVKKIRILSQEEVDTIQKNPHTQIRKIRMLPQNQINKIEENSQSQLSNKQLELEKKSDHVQQQKKIYQPVINNNSNQIPVRKINQHEIKIIGEDNESVRWKNQESLSNPVIFSADLLETQIENEDNSERFSKIGKLMNDTIGYFDRIMKDFENTRSSKIEDTLAKEKLRTSFNSQEIQTASRDPKISSANIAETIDYLEKMVGQISNQILTDEYGIPSAFRIQCTQTEYNEKEDKSSQTGQYMYYWNNEELEKTKRENHALKEEIGVLKARISALEKDLFNNTKGQFLYVIKTP